MISSAVPQVWCSISQHPLPLEVTSVYGLVIKHLPLTGLRNGEWGGRDSILMCQWVSNVTCFEWWQLTLSQITTNQKLGSLYILTCTYLCLGSFTLSLFLTNGSFYSSFVEPACFPGPCLQFKVSQTLLFSHHVHSDHLLLVGQTCVSPTWTRQWY